MQSTNSVPAPLPACKTLPMFRSELLARPHSEVLSALSEALRARNLPVGGLSGLTRREAVEIGTILAFGLGAE